MKKQKEEEEKVQETSGEKEGASGRMYEDGYIETIW